MVALNRAVAVLKVHGAEAALAPLESHVAMRRYLLLPVVCERLLSELGRFRKAEAAFSAVLQCDCSEPEAISAATTGECARLRSLINGIERKPS